MTPAHTAVAPSQDTTTKVRKRLDSETGNAAPRGNKEIRIKIKVGPKIAKFACAQKEHLGKGWLVTYQADKPCTLCMQNNLFGLNTSEISLIANQPTTGLYVQYEGDMTSWIETDTTTTTDKAALSSFMGSDPHIVVP